MAVVTLGGTPQSPSPHNPTTPQSPSPHNPTVTECTAARTKCMHIDGACTCMAIHTYSRYLGPIYGPSAVLVAVCDQLLLLAPVSGASEHIRMLCP